MKRVFFLQIYIYCLSAQFSPLSPTLIIQFKIS